MKLRDTIQKIREVKQWTQRDMADTLGVAQSDIQRMETAGRNLEKQFLLFVKLLPLLDEIGINPTQDRPTLTAKEIINHARRNGKTPGGAALVGKKGIEKASVSPIQKGRHSREE